MVIKAEISAETHPFATAHVQLRHVYSQAVFALSSLCIEQSSFDHGQLCQSRRRFQSIQILGEPSIADLL